MSHSHSSSDLYKEHLNKTCCKDVLTCVVHIWKESVVWAKRRHFITNTLKVVCEEMLQKKINVEDIL